MLPGITRTMDVRNQQGQAFGTGCGPLRDCSWQLVRRLQNICDARQITAFEDDLRTNIGPFSTVFQLFFLELVMQYRSTHFFHILQCRRTTQ